MTSRLTPTRETQTNQQLQPAPDDPPPIYDQRPLPAGWVKELDQASGRYYFVDTLHDPPRSIWTHPLDDPQFIEEHHGVGHMTDDEDSHDGHTHSTSYEEHPKTSETHPSDSKKRPVSDDEGERTANTSAGASSSSSHPQRAQDGHNAKRGFFGKIKDKTIGTKEERAAAKAKRAEEERRYYERRDKLMAQRLQEQERLDAAYREEMQRRQAVYTAHGQPGNFGARPLTNRYYAPANSAYGGPGYNGPYPYGNPYGNNRGRGYYGGGGYGGGGAGLGLLGGLAGGLLLGDLLF